jgi:hypothetical protein
MVTLGYSGWGAGQLEHELAQNAWLTVPADPRILFELPFEERLPSAWKRSASTLPTCRKRPGMPDSGVRQRRAPYSGLRFRRETDRRRGRRMAAGAGASADDDSRRSQCRAFCRDRGLDQGVAAGFARRGPAAGARRQRARDDGALHPFRQPVARPLRSAVDYAEERLSRSRPRSALRASGHNAKSAREHVDALAAQIILQCFFERLLPKNPGTPEDIAMSPRQTTRRRSAVR